MAAFPQIVALLLSVGAPGFETRTDTSLAEVQILGSFLQASRLVTTPQGWIYVTDSERNVVFRLKGDDAAVSSVGGYGWASTTFDKPTGLATDGLNLYVSDYGNHRIQRFDSNLNFISSFSTRDTSFSNARFGYPLGVALSRLGDLFVLDGDNLRVIKFAGNTRFERSFGDIDDQRSRLRQPEKILVGLNDQVYVLEPDRLLEFDYFGHYVRTIGVGTFNDACGFCLLGGGALVVTPAALFWFGGRGELVRTLRPTDLQMKTERGPFKDVAYAGDRLLVLTATQLHIIQLVLGSH
ncbi:MAG: NHL repeat-containing protein [Ignavibacteriales bacterium]|nr:NHL repeat-containing protein [Ignavibacteriales bacterium]